MEFQQLAFERRSIRGYQQKPVPREVIEEIIDVASQCPSSMNTQPWHVHVVTGDVLHSQPLVVQYNYPDDSAKSMVFFDILFDY